MVEFLVVLLWSTIFGNAEYSCFSDSSEYAIRTTSELEDHANDVDF